MTETWPAASPEFKLMLCCARVQLDNTAAEQVAALLLQDLNWPSVLHQAAVHGLMPLLHWHLNRTSPEAVPPAIRYQLLDQFRANTQHNLLLTGELLRLLKLFEGHGICAIPYKGPTLAWMAYGNLALRQFGDLDLLLHRADIVRARELLGARGYRPAFAMAPDVERAYLESLRELPLVQEQTGYIVELHSHVTPRAFALQLDPEELWQRLQSLALNGKTVLALSPEDLLLVLCVHGTKHLWQCVEWICDVAELLRTHPDLNWPWITKQAKRLCSERMLWLGLLLAHDLLQAPLPGDLVRQARGNRAAGVLAVRVQRRLFSQRDCSPSGMEIAHFHLRSRERLWHGMRYSLSLVLTPTVADWHQFSLPRRLFFFYHLFRPFRLIGKYGRSLSQKIYRAFSSQI